MINCPRRPASERGQGFLELGVSLVLLLLLFSLMIDVGYAFYTIMAMRDAAQEAASYGAICPLDADGNPNEFLIKQHLRLSATSPLNMEDIDLDEIFITYNPEPPAVGGSVKVDFTIHHHILVPFLGSIIGQNGYPLNVNVADTIIRTTWMEQCEFDE